MGIWSSIKQRFGGEPTVVVYDSRHHETIPTVCRVDTASKLLRSEDGKSWPMPEFDPTLLGKDRVYLALGEKIVPWPTREKPAYDVMDDGAKIEITPEHIDQIAEHAHQLGRMTGAAGITMWERITHIGLGAALGMIATYFLLRLVGWTGGHTVGTAVTITNATTNATTLASAFLPILFRVKPQEDEHDG